MKSLNDFKSHINAKGIVSQNRFDVTIPNNLIWAETQNLIFRCQSLNIPGAQILTSDFKLYGAQPIVKIPNGRTVDEVQMTFLTRGDMADKYFFDSWLDRIVDFSTNTVSYYDDIKLDIFVNVYNYNNEPIYTVKMVGSIPNRVEMIQVNWEDYDRLLTYTVNFSYESLEYITNSNKTKQSFKHLDKKHGNSDPTPSQVPIISSSNNIFNTEDAIQNLRNSGRLP